MSIPKQTAGVSVPKPSLPEGLSIRIDQVRKTYAWKHSTEVSSGDASLNGLRSISASSAGKPPKLASIPAKSLGEITDEKAKVISQNYMNLPSILASNGIVVLDEKREAFIQNASRVKAKLANNYGNRVIPASVMKRADDEVNKLSFSCVELTIRGFQVTSKAVKGSRQRKSDGKFLLERILRRVTIAQPLTDVQLQQMLELICGELVQSMTRTAEFVITDKGRDSHGHPSVRISLVGYNDPRSSKPTPRGNSAPKTEPQWRNRLKVE